MKSLNVAWLRKHIGVVSQEPILFDSSIAENIRFGNDSATQADVEIAAMNANAHDFIKELPKVTCNRQYQQQYSLAVINLAM